MTRIAVAALLSTLFTAACGGGAPSEPPAPPPQAAPAAPAAPAEQPPAPAPPPTEMPAAPPATSPPAPPAAKPALPAPPTTTARPAYTRTDLQVGKGTEAAKGRILMVNYTGWLYDPSKPGMKGTQFDSSIGRGPFDFTLGAGQVIPGWDEGFNGMRVGGRRRLIIPPDMGYGARGAGGVIPPNATLLFEMELLEVK